MKYPAFAALPAPLLALTQPAVADRLDDAEKSGEAAKVFETWFGPGSAEPMARKFKIQPD